MKNPLNNKGFINSRNFCNDQAPSAEVIYNNVVHTQRSTTNSTGKQTQSSTSNNSSQTQDCNLLDVQVCSQSRK